MKKFYFLWAFMLTFANLFAQDIVLTFEGNDIAGNKLKLDSVLVENLTHKAWLLLKDDFTFNLTTQATTGISENLIENGSGLKNIYPNPFETELNIEFFSSGIGKTSVSVYDVSGKTVATLSQTLKSGVHKCKFTPRASGVYFVSLNDNGQSYSSKTISAKSGSPAAGITYIEQISSDIKSEYEKGGEGDFYLPGDTLKFTVYRKTISSVKIEAPQKTATYTFEFISNVEGITVSGSDITTDGGTSQMSVSVLPDDATDKTVTWTLENNTIGATISDSGLLTASSTIIGNGTVTVKAMAKDGSGVSGTKILNISGQLSVVSGAGVTDIDGNTYQSVIIGTQEWMAANLKVTRYADGTAIPLVTDNTAWANLGDTDQAYCYYNNNASGEKDTYGALYTYAAASNNSTTQGVCPAGWHLPSDAEWSTLITYLGGKSVAGGKLKESGTTHWASPNTGADNSSGFSALPGGGRSDSDGTYYNVGNYGLWWSATQLDAYDALDRVLYVGNTNVYRFNNNKSFGFSVRCVRN